MSNYKKSWGIDIAAALPVILLTGAWYLWPPFFVPSTQFACLALIPGVLGLVSHFAGALPRYRRSLSSIAHYSEVCSAFDSWWEKTGWPRKLRAAGFVQQGDFMRIKQAPPEVFDSYRPSTAGAIWASFLLSVVFLIVAGVADASRPVGGFPLLDRFPGDQEKAINGILFAGLGAYVSVLWRMINRIHANALTSRFLFTHALRSVIAITVGLAAAQFDLFGFIDIEKAPAVIFFLVGLFTDWALTALRTRARTVFAQPATPCEHLPLCYVDGLGDGVIDILDELGIWDVQHLATSEPAELTIRTLYPFNRVIDWIDQAVLISYLRKNIVVAREFGITGAIDMALLYGYTIIEPTGPDGQPFEASPPGSSDGPAPMPLGDAVNVAQRSNDLLTAMEQKMTLPAGSLRMICTNLWFDYTVEQLYRFWQHHQTLEVKDSEKA